jgi:hypothetical protein
VINAYLHNPEHFQKMVASLNPVLSMLTTGDLRYLLSPHERDGDPRQVLDLKTVLDQLIVDPNVRDGGVVGMVAKETRRRHLLFHSNPERAMAAEFYVGQEERWQRTRH